MLSTLHLPLPGVFDTFFYSDITVEYPQLGAGARSRAGRRGRGEEKLKRGILFLLSSCAQQSTQPQPSKTRKAIIFVEIN